MMDSIDKMLQAEMAKVLSGLPSTSTTNSASSVSTQSVTWESIATIADAIRPLKAPWANPDQCKGCGAILGEKFDGIYNTPAVPLYHAINERRTNSVPFVGEPIAYLCPSCMERLKERVDSNGKQAR